MRLRFWREKDQPEIPEDIEEWEVIHTTRTQKGYEPASAGERSIVVAMSIGLAAAVGVFCWLYFWVLPFRT